MFIIINSNYINTNILEMRKLIYILPLLLVACNNEIPQKQYDLKYKEGDIVYLKPDSTKAVITVTNLDDYTYDYGGYSKDATKPGLKIREDFMEYEIYQANPLKTSKNLPSNRDNNVNSNVRY